MPDASDILKDPTAHLAAIIEQGASMFCFQDLVALHRHIQAGGPLPEQWRGEGTAVGRLLRDSNDNVGVFEDDAEEAERRREFARMTRHRMAAVTGEG